MRPMADFPAQYFKCLYHKTKVSLHNSQWFPYITNYALGQKYGMIMRTRSLDRSKGLMVGADRN